jgi:PAS domain S-box-containing protein
VNLSTRLTVAMVVLAALTATAVGWLAQRRLEANLLPVERDLLGGHAGQLAAGLDASFRGARGDVLAVAGSAAVAGLVRARLAGGVDPADGSTAAAWRDRLAENLRAEMAANPSYLQFRLIGAADEGREIVRLERTGRDGAVRVVPDEGLQRKGDRGYFTAAIALPAGGVYVSPIELNREHGAIETPHVPVLRVASPVHGPAAGATAVVIVNIDLRPILARLRSQARSGAVVYLVNERGDYLLHPDASREFGFDLGRPARLQDDLPDLADALASDRLAVRAVRDGAGRLLDCAVAPVRPAGGQRVAVVETIPRQALSAAAESVRRSSLLAGAAAAAAAVLVAVLVARSLTRPLQQITAAAEALAGGEEAAVPTAASGEIGVLARAFARMSGEIRDKATDLEREVGVRRQAEERFRQVVEASPSGLVMVDAAGTIALVNAEIERLFGYRREELVGQPIEMLVPARVRGEHAGDRRAYCAAPSARAMGAGRDLYGVRRDGGEFPVEIGLNPIRTPAGLLVLGVVVDITERKAAEEALDARTRDLERSNAELEQFAYVASHDLQEPLRMVASYTELLAERYRGRLDEKADKYIHYAVDGARRMRQLVNDLLAFSRVGTQGKAFAPVDTAGVVRRVLAGMRGAITESGAEVVCGELPTVDADESQLGQVFQNLIGNAIKFRSQAPPRIRIDAAPSAGAWKFSVADNGIGIDPAYAETVFQMFQRLHERGRYHGSGIGLAIVKKIVERHGGRVWFESRAASGTVFHFTLRPVEEVA